MALFTGHFHHVDTTNHLDVTNIGDWGFLTLVLGVFTLRTRYIVGG